MSEEEACAKIIDWAENYFNPNGDEPCTAEVVEIKYDKDDDNWVAELEVSSSADNPTVTFFERPAPHHGLQIVGVEY